MSDKQNNQQARPDAPFPGGPSQGPPPNYYPYPVPMQPAKEKRGGGVLGKLLGTVLLSLFVVSVLANVYMASFISSLFTGPREAPFKDGAPTERIVIVPISGAITGGMEDFVTSAFDLIDSNPNDMPKAVILRVDSPGGAVGASDRILHRINQFKKDHQGIKIVASYGSVAASGGYYVSCSADHIMAEPICINGSIGVIAHVPTIEKMLDNMGIEPVTVVADGSPKKDVANNMFRSFNEEDIAKLKVILNHAHEQFVDVVLAGRKTVHPDLTREDIATVANGNTYTTAEAIDAKLVDSEGYLEDAINETIKLAGISAKPRITIIQGPVKLGMMSMLGQASSGTNIINLDGQQIRETLTEVMAPRLEYRYTGAY